MKNYVLSFSSNKVIAVTAIVITFFFFGNSSMLAQQATTTINLVLADVLSIEPGSVADGGTVDFLYENVNDYNSEKTATINNSLIITFSKPFDLKVKANGATFENGSHHIPVDVLTIRKNESSQLTGSSAPVVLSTQDQVLISGADQGSKLNLDLDYIIPQARSTSSDILGKPAGIYSQKVTYTLTAI
ncbi:MULTISPECIES: peptidoglycan-binding protein LysM [Aequorivita]|uniref:Peptidoglycan-binding protein LysM n=2 Tax=Aequorivita TaxID=153265 RepID=A0AB35YTN4_9FLAO|nr:peptidoglycan-binding protein LysM [Aequorivita sp. Ant34-E75]WGF93180.1 peptidoglycan-binding protein LysM [Aequorivita sp. Ant34-E75]